MRRLSMLLTLGIAAFAVCVTAHPYSKIPDGIQLGEGFTSKKSSSSSSSNSYSHSNQDNIEIDGVHKGQAFAGSKSSGFSTNGGSHSQSNSFSSATVSGVIPIGLLSTSATSGSYATAGNNADNAGLSSQVGYGALQNPGTGYLNLQHGSADAINAGFAGDSAVSGYDQNAHGSESDQFQSYGSSGAANSGQAGHATSGQYWWNGPNNPFTPNGKPSTGCSSSGCSASGILHLSNKNEGGVHAANQAGHVEIKFQGNPFLHQQTVASGGSGSAFAFGSSGGSSSGSSASGQSGSIDVSRNPFLNGAGISASSAASSHTHSTNYGGSSSGQASDTSNNAGGSGNSFFNSGSASGVGSVFGQQIPQIPSVSGNAGSGNPFFRPQVPHVPQVSQVPHIPQIPQIPQISQGQENIFVQQQTGGFPLGGDEQHVHQEQESTSGFGGGLSLTCNGYGKICVPKHLCSNGYVSNNDLTQIRSGPQVCSVDSEVCCTLKSQNTDQSQSGSFSDHSTIKTNFGSKYHKSGSSNGGIFGNTNVNHEQTDLSTGEPVHRPNTYGNSNNGADSNGYLPPLGSEPSSNVPAFSRPPVDDVPPEDEGTENEPVPTNPRPNTIFPPPAQIPVQVGCAAALICVEEQYCTLAGVISPEPLAFTSEQILRRAPLSSCKNPDNGVIGKCCRDPNYVDPWPTGNLPANYSGGFDEQGFPTFLNIAKTRPPKKQQPSPTKGGQPTKTFGRPPVHPEQRLPPFPQIQNIPNQIANIPNHITNFFQRPTQAPEIPQGNVNNGPAPFPSLPTGISTTPSNDTPKPFPGLPTIPRPNYTVLQNPFTKNNYDTSSSNENAIVIPPHVPGSQCGIRNKVQRPNGLTDVDVAFGEIPWQAMVLSTRDRKLLCSGAIVSPNAIITAARCVEGFNANDVSIKTGEWKLGYELKHEEPLPFEIIRVATIVPYPAYAPGNPAHDVAMLLLEHPIALNQHVDMLCMPEGQPQPPQPGRKCIATGWGKTVLQVNVAGALMHSIDVDILDNDQCQQRIAGAEAQITLDDSLICTKAYRQNNNMCQVDLGGPLACDRGDGYYELAGVYNQDTGCLPTNQVATFATIPTGWVKEVIENPLPVYSGESQEPTNVAQKNIVHNHGPEEACDCQKSNLPSENNQYLPPQ